jgi:hypothetical protein
MFQHATAALKQAKKAEKRHADVDTKYTEEAHRCTAMNLLSDAKY